jgi:cytochrome P450
MTVGDTVTVDDLDRDPYPIYARLRAEEPVSWVESVSLWLVTQWDDVRGVTLNPDQFTAATQPSTLDRTFGRNMLASEGPYHKRIRRIVEPAFRAANLRPMADALIRPLADGLIDSFVDRGHTDLMAEFAEPLSVGAVKQVLGLREVPDDVLRRWFVELATGAANFEGDPGKQEVADRASQEVDATVEDLLRGFESHPDDSILSRMLHAEVDGERLTREEIRSNLKVMIVGGMQEPADFIGLAAHALLSHPDQFGEVLEDRTLLHSALEEAARWHSPVGTSTRQTTEPVEMHGTRLESGSLVAAVLASANRDEQHWSRPAEFNIHRQEHTHLAFAAGAHHCIGAHLARLIARTAFEQLLDRLPELRLNESRPAEFSGWEFRRPLHLDVEWAA